MPNVPSGTITFLFTDIEGSTMRWEAHPLAMQAAFTRQEAILRHAIEINGGYAYKMIGDAFQAAFPTAPQALQAAIDSQFSLHTEEWPTETGEVRVRMALHTGTTEERAGDYVGPALNRVARLLSAAHGEQILISEVTYGLVRDALPAGVQLFDMGEHRLKDLIRPEHIFQLIVSGLRSQFLPIKTLDNRPNNLPLQPTLLIGREKEVADVVRLLASERKEIRLVTLTGPGGTGKTRLSLQVAAELLEHFPDGVWLVELAPLMEASMVVLTIASVLGVREGTGVGGSTPIADTLKEYLKEKSLLLVLDNFEHVVVAAPQVSQLLASCPNLKVLVTSQVPLRIRGEKEYPVPPLSVPDVRDLQHLPPVEQIAQYEAVRLFIERATDVKPDFEVNNANAPAVAQICARLDGLPLAIELAAARVRMLSPDAILARLSKRLKLLTGGAKDLPARQQTLHNTIAWSYDLLGEEEKQLFRRMAPFNGGRSLEALEAVCNYDEQLGIDVFEGTESLLSKSLLKQVDESGGEPRFWMLETIHEYAREQLEESGESKALGREHARYFMALAEEAAPHLKQQDQSSWLERMEDANDNMRAAFGWAGERGEAGDMEAAEIGLRLAIALERFWEVRVHLREGLEQTVGILAIGKPGGAIRARALKVAAALADVRGDYARAHLMLAESMEIWQELGDKKSLVETLHALGNVFYSQRDIEQARYYFEESLRIEQEVGERKTSLHSLGLMFYEQGDYSSAASLIEEALAIERGIGDTRRVALALANLGLVACEQGDYELALSRQRESLAIRQELGAKLGIAWSLEGLATSYLGLGRVEKSACLWGASQAMREAIGAPLPPKEHTRYKREIDVVRAQLGEEGFQRAYAQGQSMTSDQAVEYALDSTVTG
ncbi:MAG: tetratricopeptide repeat protein [Chloroflexota bacterium]